MKKTRLLMIVLFIVFALFLAPNITNAAEVTVERNAYSNNGSMKFNFSGLTLDTTHEYEFGLTKTPATKVENWHLIIEYTANTAKVDVSTMTEDLREVVNITDTGYITIKDKTADKIVLQPYGVDLKIPYLSLTNYRVIPNGKHFNSYDEQVYIEIALRDTSNSKPYYQYEKITDQNVINKYKEIKKKNGDFKELQKNLKQTPPSSNWNKWKYWDTRKLNGLDGYGYTQSDISVPDSGLYYMWIYISGDNLKDMYGYILVDNLAPDIALEGVTLPKTEKVELGKTLTLPLGYNPTNATNKIVTWTSSDETVATIDNAGKITPKKVGSTIITVVSQDGNRKATCTVTVTGVQNNKQPDNNKNEEDKNSGTTNNDNKQPSNADKNSGTTNNDNKQPSNTNQNSSTTNNNSDTKKDTTTAPIKKIPQAGQTVIAVVIGVIALLAVSVVMYKKYSQYKDIK